MKMNKNTLTVATLLLTALGLMLAMIVLLLPNSNFILQDTKDFLTILSTLISTTAVFYSFAVLKRVKPIKYIYFSFAYSDIDIVEKIKFELNNNLSSSKFRFNIISNEDISFGEDIYNSIQNNINKSEIFIVIVSSAYLDSRNCINEFNQIIQKSLNNQNKIIPIVLESFDDLQKLPKDLSDIKSLYLCDKSSEADFSKQLELLGKDLIKQRKEIQK